MTLSRRESSGQITAKAKVMASTLCCLEGSARNLFGLFGRSFPYDPRTGRHLVSIIELGIGGFCALT